MSDTDFDFEAWRQRYPDHWDEDGWPIPKSTWRSRPHPYLRVRVLSTIKRDRVAAGSLRADELAAGRAQHGDVKTLVYWDGSLDELLRLFTYETTDRWNIDSKGFVYGSGGIDRNGRWLDEGVGLQLIFDREQFGGPDTWHRNFEEPLPFFEPVLDWDDE